MRVVAAFILGIYARGLGPVLWLERVSEEVHKVTAGGIGGRPAADRFLGTHPATWYWMAGRLPQPGAPKGRGIPMVTNGEECGLCGGAGPIRDSHLLPASAYSLIRRPGEPIENPVWISGGDAATTSKQVTKRFLCDACETRFADRERFVMAQCNRRGRFDLLSQLVGLSPLHTERTGTRLYDLEGAQAGRWEEYAYFAASVVWRAAATDWPTPNGVHPKQSLGKYLEPVRRYLLGWAAFPEHVYVRLEILGSKHLHGVTVLPKRERTRLPHAPLQHHFSIPGIFFFVVYGKMVPTFLSATAINTPGPRVVFVGGKEESGLGDAIVRASVAAQPRGRLREWLERVRLIDSSPSSAPKRGKRP